MNYSVPEEVIQADKVKEYLALWKERKELYEEDSVYSSSINQLLSSIGRTTREGAINMWTRAQIIYSEAQRLNEVVGQQAESNVKIKSLDASIESLLETCRKEAYGASNTK